MKKEYFSPEIEMFKFALVTCAYTASGVLIPTDAPEETIKPGGEEELPDNPFGF